MKIKQLSQPIFVMAALGLSGYAVAGSFSLTTQSLSARSLATAGSAAFTDDASVLYTNPANMTQIKAPSVSLGYSFVTVGNEISNVTGGISGGTNKGDFVPDSQIPSGYVVSPVNHAYDPNLYAGIGVYAPFGFHGDYEDTFAGREHADLNKFKVRTLAPSVAYAIGPMFSAGVSMTINQADGYLSSKPLNGTLNASLEGDDTNVGYTVGLALHPSERFNVGAVYRSEVQYNLKGTVISPSTPAGIPGSLTIETPASAEIAFKFGLTSDVNVYANYTLTKWAQLQKLTTTTASSSSSEVIGYEDSDTYGLGADWQLGTVKLRAGVALDQTPTTDKDRSLRLPTTDRMLYAIGANIGLGQYASVDVGYSYVDEDTAPINRPANLAAGAINAYSANFKNTAHIGMLQLNYKF